MLSIIPQTIRIPSRHIVTDSYVTFFSGANMWAITLVANIFYAPDDLKKKKEHVAGALSFKTFLRHSPTWRSVRRIVAYDRGHSFDFLA